MLLCAYVSLWLFQDRLCTVLITVLTWLWRGRRAGGFYRQRKLPVNCSYKTQCCSCSRRWLNFKVCDVSPAAFQVRDNATLVLSRVLHSQPNYDQNHENHEEREYSCKENQKQAWLRCMFENTIQSFVFPPGGFSPRHPRSNWTC